MTSSGPSSSPSSATGSSGATPSSVTKTFSFLKKRSKKTGLPPGTPVLIGENHTEPVRITAFEFDEAVFTETAIHNASDCLTYRDTTTIAWIDVDGIHDVAAIERIGADFGIHPLTIEDILNTDQRPKFEDYGEYLFVALKMLRYIGDDLDIEHVSLIIGPSWVISFQERPGGDVFDPVRDRIRTGKGRVRRNGSDYLAYSLMDIIVDNYFLVMERLNDIMETMEDRLLTDPSQETLLQLSGMKRDMLFLRHSISPLRELINLLWKSYSPLIKDQTDPYFRDLYDHAIHLVDSLDTLRDFINGMLDIYLSSLSNRLNEVMKVFTVISTIFIPLTFLTSIYGMNFHYMPELEWRWGYYTLLAFLAIAVGLMFWFFKRKRWL